MGNGFIIILIISIILPSPHVQNKKSSKAEKANTKLCIIASLAVNPRKDEYNLT